MDKSDALTWLNIAWFSMVLSAVFLKHSVNGNEGDGMLFYMWYSPVVDRYYVEVTTAGYLFGLSAIGAFVAGMQLLRELVADVKHIEAYIDDREDRRSNDPSKHDDS